MIVTLPNELEDWIASRVQTDGFASADDFILDLVQQERERAFDDAIAAGEASGVSPRTFDEIIDGVRSKLKAVAS